MTTLDAPEIRRNHERPWPFPAATAVAVFLSLCAVSSALQSQSIPTPPAYALIKEPEIRADMLVMAGDAMRGRESGTPDEITYPRLDRGLYELKNVVSRKKQLLPLLAQLIMPPALLKS